MGALVEAYWHQAIGDAAVDFSEQSPTALLRDEIDCVVRS